MAKVQLKTPVACKVVNDAMTQCSKRLGRKIDYKNLSTVLKINPSSLWYPIKGQRAWTVDRWLIVLQSLGCLSFQGDHIIISSSKFSNFTELFNTVEMMQE